MKTTFARTALAVLAISSLVVSACANNGTQTAPTTNASTAAPAGESQAQNTTGAGQSTPAGQGTSDRRDDDDDDQDDLVEDCGDDRNDDDDNDDNDDDDREVVSRDGASVRFIGRCSEITITARGASVTFESVGKLVIDGGESVVTGMDADDITVNSDGNSVTLSGKAGNVRVTGNNNNVQAAQVGGSDVQGNGNTVG